MTLWACFGASPAYFRVGGGTGYPLGSLVSPAFCFHGSFSCSSGNLCSSELCAVWCSWVGVNRRVGSYLCMGANQGFGASSPPGP